MNFDEMYMNSSVEAAKIPQEPPIEVKDSEVITLPKIDVTAPRLDEQGNVITPQRNTIEGPTKILPRGSMMPGTQPVLSRGALPEPNIIDQLTAEGVGQFVEDVSERPVQSIYGAGRGLVQGAVGQYGDWESIGRGIVYALTTPEGKSRLEEFIRGMEVDPNLATTEEVGQFLSQFIPESGTPGAEGAGELIAPAGVIRAGIKGAALAGRKLPKVLNIMPIGKSSEIITDAKLRTKNFQNWFKQSKVVDENNTPLVVYHGTTENFDAFDINKIGKNESGTKGFFFSDDPVEAAKYADNDSGNIMPVYISMQNPLVEKYNTRTSTVTIWENQKNKRIQQALENGNDGIIIDNGKEKLIVPFKPNQIKSASANKGTYNVDDDNILNSAIAAPALMQNEDNE